MKSVEVKLVGRHSKCKISVDEVLCIPVYGPCRVLSIDEKDVLGEKLIVCTFDNSKEKVKISIPINMFEKTGVRYVSEPEDIEKAIKSVLKKHSNISKCTWTKRVQEYELRFNSGNLVRIIEIIKDLYVGVRRFDKSYSERLLFNKAFDFLVSEFAISNGIIEEEANRRLTDLFDSVLCKEVNKEKVNIDIDDDDDFDDSDIEDNEDDEKIA